MGEKDHGEPLKYDPSWVGVNLERGFRGDSIFGLFFLVVFIASIVVGGYALSNGKPTILDNIEKGGKQLDEHFNFISKAARGIRHDKWIIVGSAFGTMIVAMCWVALLRYFCRAIIYASVVLGVVGFLAGGIALLSYAISHGHEKVLEALGFVCLGVAVIAAFIVFLLRKKIDFTATLIQEACSGLFHNLSLFTLVAPIMFALLVGYVAFWVVSIVYLSCIPDKTADPITFRTEPTLEFPEGEMLTMEKIDKNKQWALLFMVFSLFWFLTLKTAVLWATYSGAVAQWYFGRTGLAVSGIPALTSLRFALTYNLGSLAFGSLILAIFDFINFLLTKAEKESPNCCIGCIFRAIRCCCCCIRGILEYINSYAYIYIALHGYSFPKAAQEVMKLLGRCGLDRVISDTITTWVIWFGNFFCAGIMVAIHIGIAHAQDGGINGWSLLITAAISLVVFYFVSLGIRVGADTVFVCYAEDTERNAASRDYQYNAELHDCIQSRVNVLKHDI
eukprot:TRINITY_DN67836_c7_g1_i1.p1 TRINITY_DN67836_c7_g1~~TRINITY_DN67836_c7_g1_i1.p1  ORF type:complete len:504 (+),score=44.60 TRINITY_DN67836_c7_g1_i1:22-1533(+)